MFKGKLNWRSPGSLARTPHQAFDASNASKISSGAGNCVPALVSAQAAVTPNAAAVVRRGEVVTYAKLEARSNEVAHQLRAVGVGPEVLVGLCLPRSTELVVGALGVLKAGGAYLPLDPEDPPDRIAWMLNDAKPAVVVTTTCLAERIPAGPWQTLEIDRRVRGIAAHIAEQLECMAPESLAYVIYTSGSTGRPKGVEITHGSLLNLVLWHQTAFEVKPSDRASQLASPGFDAAVWELWPYLTVGASVHFVENEIRGDPEALRYWLLSQSITISFVPTPMTERIITLEWPRETPLRILLTGADALRKYPPPNLPFTLINNYGPTECTVVASSGPVLPNGHCDVLPSIGRPISNVQIHILNEQGEPVPVSTPGEIYIGGAGVARGYRNAPELTMAKFVGSPFDTKPGRHRLYRTGDLGCYLPDGQIAFRGRMDEQIKIRGYRVEPNEIITALAQHPAVQASAVMAREHSGGDKQLIAYIVPTAESTLTDGALREFLSSQLPDYMVPAVFVRMDSLPLNGSGKIDRAALPPPDESNSLREEIYVAPRRPVEQRLADIVAPLLGIEKVSVEDNFFMLGGHSLLGTQLIARTREVFGIELSLRTLFESPTIAGLAQEVERLLYARLEAMTEQEAELLLKRIALSAQQEI